MRHELGIEISELKTTGQTACTCIIHSWNELAEIRHHDQSTCICFSLNGLRDTLKCYSVILLFWVRLRSLGILPYLTISFVLWFLSSLYIVTIEVNRINLDP